MTTAIVLGACPCTKARHADGDFAGYLFQIGHADIAGMPRNDVERLALAGDDAFGDDGWANDDLGDVEIGTNAVLWPTPEPQKWWRDRAKSGRFTARIASALTRHGAWIATNGRAATKKAQRYESWLTEIRAVVDEMRSLLPKEGEQPSPEQVELAERYGRLSTTYYDLATGFYANAYPKDGKGKAILPAGLVSNLQTAVRKAGGGASKGGASKGDAVFKKVLRDASSEVVGGCPCTRGDDFILQYGAVFGDVDADYDGEVGAIPVIFVGLAVVIGVAGVAWALSRTPDAIVAVKQARVDRDWIAANRGGEASDVRRGEGGAGGKGSKGLVLGLLVLGLLAGGAVVMSK